MTCLAPVHLCLRMKRNRNRNRDRDRDRDRDMDQVEGFKSYRQNCSWCNVDGGLPRDGKNRNRNRNRDRKVESCTVNCCCYCVTVVILLWLRAFSRSGFERSTLRGRMKIIFS